MISLTVWIVGFVVCIVPIVCAVVYLFARDNPSDQWHQFDTNMAILIGTLMSVIWPFTILVALYFLGARKAHKRIKRVAEWARDEA